jgi:hypothetical protein
MSKDEDVGAAKFRPGSTTPKDWEAWRRRQYVDRAIDVAGRTEKESS